MKPDCWSVKVGLLTVEVGAGDLASTSALLRPQSDIIMPHSACGEVHIQDTDLTG